MRRTRSNEAGKSERPGKTQPFSGTNATSNAPPVLDSICICAASRRCRRKSRKELLRPVSRLALMCLLPDRAQRQQHRNERSGGERCQIAPPSDPRGTGSGPSRASLRHRASASTAAKPCKQERESGHENRNQRDVHEGEKIAQRVDVLAQIVLHVAQCRAGLDQFALEAVDLSLLFGCNVRACTRPSVGAAALFELVEPLLNRSQPCLERFRLPAGIAPGRRPGSA